jgi:hypothetical protein
MGGTTRADARTHAVRTIALLAAASLALAAGAASPGPGAVTRSRATHAAADLTAAAPARPSATTTSPLAAPVGPHRVAMPAWWQGETCDQANAPGSYAIGASWDGLVACGPGPTQGGSDHLVDFFPGSWGEFEWECVELSMRWMYLAWGVNPYPADGWDVVSDYDTSKASDNPGGPDLVVVENGTVGAVPQPGDVVSVGRSTDEPFGHTAVVTANAVDAQGNGTITLIQENGGGGNDGWVTYPVDSWVVGDNVTGWLHNPSWTFQRPIIGFTRSAAFEARVVAPGNSFGPLAGGATSIAVAGDTGAAGVDGQAFYGYIAQNGDFYARRALSLRWVLVAEHATSIALAATSSGAPVLAFLNGDGDFYAESGSLTGRFRLEARGVASIALADNGGSATPLLGYLRHNSGAFLVKLGVAGGSWTVVQPSGVRSIALAEGAARSSALLGYVSTNGSFFAKTGMLGGRWTKEASGVSAISLAVVGPTGTPLLAFLAKHVLSTGEGVSPSTWIHEALGVTAMAVAAGAPQGAVPVVGYLTTGGDLEVRQGALAGRFTLQARDVSSMAISSLTDS